MKALQHFNQIIKDHTTIALATSIDQEPNVRILNFITRKENPGVLYFATFKNNIKVVEFASNNKVAFTSIPNENTAHIRVNSARVLKSNLSIHELATEFITRVPDYKEIIDVAADALDIYEIHFEKATVTIDYNSIFEVEFQTKS